MTFNQEWPTPYPDVNFMIQQLMAGVRSVLGSRLVGMYLDGSLTSGDFDEDSDIDFLAVTEDELSEDDFVALREMHDRLATTDSVWAVQIEGSYLSRHAVRRYDPAYTLYPNMERGRGERLKLVHHDNTWWPIHRYIVRERGIRLLGPEPQSLIDPVLPAELRQAVQSTLTGWAAGFLSHPEQIRTRGYQSYIVLTLCRILYTLATDDVTSKRTAAKWAQEILDSHWIPLIESAWEGRHRPDMEPFPEDVAGTLDLIRFTLAEKDHLHE